MTHTPALIDSLRDAPTPEGCRLGLRLAGPVARSRAFFIDLLFRVALFAAAIWIFSFAGSFGRGMILLLFFVQEWLYPVAFELLWNGATPGKRFCGLAVVRADGTPVGFDASAIRNALRFVDALPIGYAVGLIAMALDSDGRRLGDIAAGTVVVYRLASPPRDQAGAIDGVEPPPFPLTEAEQRALLEYRLRSGTLTSERAEELAALARPLTGSDRPEHGRRRLLRMADFLLGRGD